VPAGESPGAIGASELSTDAEIREWARSSGRDVTARGKLPADVRAEYLAAHPVTEQDDGVTELVIELPSEPVTGDVAEPAPAAEEPRAPRRPETPPRGRKRRLFERKDAKPGQRKPARVSLDSLASWAWGLGGLALQQAPKSLPVGRMLALQAPVAGVVVDDLAKGTALDRILQPLARSSEKAEKAFALFGPPVLVGIISNKPELFPHLVGPLKVAMLSWVEISEPAMRKAEAKAKAMAERVGEVDVDAIIAALFADLPVPQPSADEEAAIRRARGDG
jgi:hypothetical protein